MNVYHNLAGVGKHREETCMIVSQVDNHFKRVTII